MIYQTYKKQVEAWKERFVWKDNALDPIANILGLPRKEWRPMFGLPEREIEDLLSSRHKDTIELIEAIRDWAVDKRQFATACEQRAYTKIITALEEQIKLIKNEQ